MELSHAQTELKEVTNQIQVKKNVFSVLLGTIPLFRVLQIVVYVFSELYSFRIV